MKLLYNLKLIVIIIIIVVSISFIDTNYVFATTLTPIPYLYTPKNEINFNKGDLITIYDSEWSNMNGKPAVMKIFNPDGKLYLSRPFSLGYGTANFTITGPLAIPGYYQITLYYDNQTHVGTTILYDIMNADPNRYYTYIASSGNVDIPIKYKVDKYTSLEYLTFDHNSNTLYLYGLTYGPTSYGSHQITIELPRNIIDSKISDGNDYPYVVTRPTADGFTPYNGFTEVANNNLTRTLVITPPNSLFFVTAIQGTQSIPEFGSFSSIVLIMSAVIAVFIYKRKNNWFYSSKVVD